MEIGAFVYFHTIQCAQRTAGARAPPCGAPPRFVPRPAAATVTRARDAARARRAAAANLDPLQRAARHAMSIAGTTALQDAMAELDRRRREARDTATRMSDLARARRAAVMAARASGGMRTVHVRRVTLLLAGETAPRRARVRAAAAAAAANNGPIDTINQVTVVYCRGRGNSLPRSPRRLTACVIGVGHASVHCDSDPRAWGSGTHTAAAAATPPSIAIAALVLGGPDVVRARARVVLNSNSFHRATKNEHRARLPHYGCASVA